MVRAVIVDDSRLMREMLRAALEADTGITVVGAAADPYEAREVIRSADPDVVTLDVEMPRMDGLEFLERMMRLRPVPVVMVAGSTVSGAENTMKALELGAVDFIAKPSGREDWDRFSRSIRRKVLDAAGARLRGPGGDQQPVLRPPLPPAAQQAPDDLAEALARCELIAIGASTGGVAAIHRLLDGAPRNAPPMVITQHMPPMFTARFAERLASATGIDTAEASQGEVLQRGRIRIAPGDQHLRILRRSGRLVCALDGDPPVSGHRPSVDVLFESVASASESRAVGIILTGMGRDGATGLLSMRRAGALTLGEAEASCVVYGMPKAAMQAGAVSRELEIDQIAARLRCPAAGRRAV
jgi:two-component system chemotaxis response regulator CheB